MPNPKDDALEPNGKLKRKEYGRELAYGEAGKPRILEGA